MNAVKNRDSFLDYLSECRIAVSFWQYKKFSEINQLKKQGCEIAEIRIDLANIKNHEEAQQLIKKYKSLPIILTVRHKQEGGQWDGDETHRLALIKSLLPLCDAIDIELSAIAIIKDVIEIATKQNKAIIAARHNLQNADSLSQIEKSAAKAYEMGAHIYKHAGIIHNQNGLDILQTFTKKYKDQRVITIGIGENKYARKSRVLLPQKGSLITYANIGKVSADQLTLKEIYALLKPYKR